MRKLTQMFFTWLTLFGICVIALLALKACGVRLK